MGEHRLLVHQLPQIDVWLQQRRADTAQQPRLDLARHAENAGGDGDDQHHLHGLQHEIEDQRHSATTTSSRIRVQNTSVR